MDDDVEKRVRRPDSSGSSPEAPEEGKLLYSKEEIEGDELEDEKAAYILEACESGDLSALKKLAESDGGLLNDVLRRRAWPILLGIPIGTTEAEADAESDEVQPWRDLPCHKDEDQVQLDVNRAFTYYPIDNSTTELERRKAELFDLIVEVLRRYPFLCYFQGYHEICSVFLLVLDPPWRARLAARLSVLRIRDFMLPTLAATVHQLRLIPDLLEAADPTLRRHLGDVEPFYALAGTITMYAHVIKEYGDIARLFDVLLAREPVFSIYLYARIVLSRRDELFEFPPDDSSMLLLVLSKVPKKLDLETLITETADLFERHPPDSLHSWRRISASSPLKTARSPGSENQSLEEGHAHFEKQAAEEAAELRRRERSKKLAKRAQAYRGPALAMFVAVATGMLAIYLRRNPGPLNYLMSVTWRFTKGGD